jgi:hypothetical protein
MRYRKLDDDGDFLFGHGAQDFWTNVPDAPAQAVMTRLMLFVGDWFLDTSDGMDWNQKVLGKFTAVSRDPAIQERILGTPGVRQPILDYSSDLNRDTRRFVVDVSLDTIYGQIRVVGPR